MPEGPEVRKYADALDAALTGRAIVSFEARTKEARKWLQENEQRILGRRVERVVSHGKHLLGYIEGDFFFHSHLMMWGRWQTLGPAKGRRNWRATHTSVAQQRLKRIANEWQAIRRWFTSPAVSTERATWSFDALTCHVCAAARRFASSGKELFRIRMMKKSARG